MTIEFNVERLVLDGLEIPSGQRQLLQAAIEDELARLLRQDGVHARFESGAHERINGADVSLAVSQGPQQLGQQIAGSIFGSLTRPASTLAVVPPASFPDQNPSR